MQAPGISIDTVLLEVRKDVVELAKTVGHEQVPAIYDQMLGNFLFPQIKLYRVVTMEGRNV